MLIYKHFFTYYLILITACGVFMQIKTDLFPYKLEIPSFKAKRISCA